jgi:hypothetical protein
VLGVGIEPDNRLINGKHRGQLQLCVPPMALKGDSYRLKDRDLGRVSAATTNKD